MQEVLIVGTQLAVVGIVVVFVALALVALVVSNLKYVDRWFNKEFHQQTLPHLTQASTSELVATDAIPPELVAVISAAVVVALGDKTRVKRIRYRRQADASWQVQGRATIMASHTTRNQ